MRSLERRKKIIDILNKHEQVKVKEIAKILAEKENNIRRDIRILRDMGLLSKVYGGIKIPGEENIIEKYFYDEIYNNSEKELIAQKAVEYIQENDTIFLSSGTTVFKLAEILYRYDYKLNIITLSLPVATLLAKKNNFNLIFIGGTLIRENFSFEGSLVEQLLKFFNIDKAFVGVRGFSYDHGFTIPTMEQVTTLRALARFSGEINVLVDHTKFLKRCLIILSTFDDELIRNKIRRVITDKTTAQKDIDRLKEEGTEVVVV
ncbi:MAG: DeoR/GlpR family DNA-binding transcription regulator [Actinobacteria bacterium]|nr:DeoR/GlpR family DNA-binding transcription regulator [Actinomycetota bacterium]